MPPRSTAHAAPAARGASAGRCVALLRGINVGKAKRVAMADLRALVEALGYGDVRTLLNSGNVVFTARRGAAEDAARRIERALEERLGVAARVMAVDAATLDAIVASNPFADVATDPARYLVGVLASTDDAARLRPLAERAWTPEALAVGPRAAYMWCAEGIVRSALTMAVGRAVGDAITTRNWATITKLHALVTG